MQIDFLKGVTDMFNFLEAAPEQGGNLWLSVGMIVVMFALFYFFMLRPQKKREKEVNAMRSGVQVGDEIITIGGICGKIVKTKEESLIIQVGADKVKFEIMRWAVSKVVEESKRVAKAADEQEVEEEVKKAKPRRMKKAAPVEEEVIDFTGVEIEPLFAEDVDFETFSKSDFRAVKVKDCVAVPKSKKLLQFTLDDGTGTDRTILSGIHAFYEPEELIGKTLVAITNLPPRKMMGIESCGMLLSAVHTQNGEEKLNLLMVSNKIAAGAKLY